MGVGELRCEDHGLAVQRPERCARLASASPSLPLSPSLSLSLCVCVCVCACVVAFVMMCSCYCLKHVCEKVLTVVRVVVSSFQGGPLRRTTRPTRSTSRSRPAAAATTVGVRTTSPGRGRQTATTSSGRRSTVSQSEPRDCLGCILTAQAAVMTNFVVVVAAAAAAAASATVVAVIGVAC